MQSKLGIFAVLLLLSGCMLAAASASSAAAESPIDPLALEEEFEAEEGELEEGSCKEAEEEFDEGELSATEVEEICKEEEEEEQSRKRRAGPSGEAPEECVLRSAHAHAATPGRSNELKLTIDYTTYEPVTATIEVGHLATLHRHLGKSGVLRIVRPLHGQHLNRLVVDIRLPSVKRAGCPSRRLVLFPR